MDSNDVIQLCQSKNYQTIVDKNSIHIVKNDCYRTVEISKKQISIGNDVFSTFEELAEFLDRIA